MEVRFLSGPLGFIWFRLRANQLKVFIDSAPGCCMSREQHDRETMLSEALRVAQQIEYLTQTIEDEDEDETSVD